jgi:hypothetical protein
MDTSVTNEGKTTERVREKGAGYYFLLFTLLAISGLYFGFAIPTFVGILGG